MRWLFLLNGLGVVAASTHAGLAMADGMVPVFGLAAAFLFLAGLFLPFISEYISFGKDFGDVGGDFLAEERKSFFPSPSEPEIFAAHDRRPTLHRKREPIRLVVAIFLLAAGLSSIEIARHLEFRAEHEIDRKIITNF